MDTDLHRKSEITGNRSKISIKRSSLDTTVCTDEGRSSAVTTSERNGSSDKVLGLVSTENVKPVKMKTLIKYTDTKATPNSFENKQTAAKEAKIGANSTYSKHSTTN